MDTVFQVRTTNGAGPKCKSIAENGKRAAKDVGKERQEEKRKRVWKRSETDSAGALQRGGIDILARAAMLN